MMYKYTTYSATYFQDQISIIFVFSIQYLNLLVGVTGFNDKPKYGHVWYFYGAMVWQPLNKWITSRNNFDL